MTRQNYATDLAEFIEQADYGCEEDGLHLGPSDLTLVAKALRVLATLADAITPSEAPELA